MNDHELTAMVRAVWYSVIVVVFNQTRHVGAMSKKQEKKKDTARTLESGESYRYRCLTRVGHRYFAKNGMSVQPEVRRR